MGSKTKSVSGMDFLKKYLDYAVITLIYLILHFMMHTNYWDDLAQANTMREYHYNVFAYAAEVYSSWSSRVLIQPVWVLLCGIPNMIWKTLDVVMILIIYHFMKKSSKALNGAGFENKVWAMLFFLSFPYSLMATAGWIATSVTYTWTFAGYFYCLYLLLKSAKGDRCTPVQYVIYGIAVFWVGNFNITSVSLVLLLSVIFFLYQKNKSFTILYIEGMVLTAMNLFLFVASPGNRIRNVRDAEFHNSADLMELSLLGKLRMGINSTFYHFVSVPNAVLFTICVILAICTWKKSKTLWQKSIGFVPLVIDVFWTCYMFFAYIVKNGVLTYTYPDGAFMVCPKTEQYLAMISAIAMVVAICYLVAYLTEFGQTSAVLIGNILLFGLLPQVALGFTTTVTTSSIRMSTFFYMALMLCGYVLVEKCELLKDKLWKIGMYFVVSAGAVLNILQVIRHIMVYG